MTSISARRFVFREECREEARQVHGALVALSIFGIADTNRSFNVYSPIGLDKNGQEALVGPYFRTFDDMIEELL